MSGQELRIRIEPGEDGAFRVFASAPSGEVTGTFTLPFDERDMELFVLRISRGRAGSRRAESSEMRQITEFGGALFGALFQGRVGELYRVARSTAESEQESLRVTLSLTDAPELMRLPWEYLYDEPDFLAISRWTPVVRYLEMRGGRRPLKVELPLRILAMVSSPEGVAELDTDRERANLEQALSGLLERGAIEITWLEEATLSALLRTLERGPFHVFHYIGHGLYDPQADDGVLVFEDERNQPRKVTGRDLGQILADHTTLRLAVLNACEGARASSDDPFAGVATSLVQRQIPAVIAMQFEITDRAAIVFAGEFYWKLADCGLVDTALAFARQAIFADGNEVEWATPVLFMRVPDGRIFDVPEAPVPYPERPSETLESGPDVPGGGPPVPWWRHRAAAIGGAALALVAALALAITLITRDGGTGTTTTGPEHPAWSLRGAIPTAVLGSCGENGQSLTVPGTLQPQVRNGTVSFRSSYACPSAADGVTLVQYSLASSIEDLNTYFNWRLNARGLPAFRPTPNLCGTGESASNHWKPAAALGHTPIPTGEGAGRVLCYELNGQARIEWTDTRSRTFGFAVGPSRENLVDWWEQAAGPTPPP